MNRTPILLAFVSLLPADTSAQGADPTRAMAKCAVIAGDLERLECYDALARALNIDGPQTTSRTPVTGTGEWVIRDETNPIDDTRTVLLGLTASTGRSSFGEPISLILQCKSREVSAAINWNDYLGSDAYVTARVGSQEASRRAWVMSTNSQGSFYPGDATQFIDQLQHADRFVAQVTPYNENPVTAVFALSGLPNAIKPLREACPW